ncbi:MAG: isoprenylcysteine carboxylmethyltransferase family protein [Rhodobacter sp.]|nr:isoprenylcysteine carboxylmethyltransferase family protein [Rhodobacter sp.]MCA3514868.1 isoprenylcysteine carboxylmethyltransferase family protein [Rhodobacter sp.]MCA3520179.1 isoprenylcysteine carboxylmethyltransferase family protein [Rhodobacter sp.]MCA3522110.1 isoprenylcysteine carboxylmethyltransferase family protein [Rhodobacter sp.]MCA3524685.1 isoprenylcysteine carboxylmethyltransferase family protein [Rhodobacter sp.]
MLFPGLAAVQARHLPLIDAGRPGLIAGAVPGFLALAVFAFALPEFQRHRTTDLPRERPAAMMDTGICPLPCSPICLADAMALAGAAPRWDAASLLLVPVSVRVITQRFIPRGGRGGAAGRFRRGL